MNYDEANKSMKLLPRSRNRKTSNKRKTVQDTQKPISYPYPVNIFILFSKRNYYLDF